MKIEKITNISSNPDCEYCGGDDIIIDPDKRDCDDVIQITPCPICLPEFFGEHK